MILKYVGRVLVFGLLSNAVHAREQSFNFRKLLGPYPAKGSVEEAEDLETLLKYQENRTAEDCRLAALEEEANLKNFFVRPGLLTKIEATILSVRLIAPLAQTGVKVTLAKMYFNRIRPYENWPEITPCIKKAKSKAYPSGHTTLARVYARILADLYPKKAKAFLQRADEVALNRVIGGVHHPSDIVAGKKLGDAIANELLDSKQYVELKADLF